MSDYDIMVFHRFVNFNLLLHIVLSKGHLFRRYIMK